MRFLLAMLLFLSAGTFAQAQTPKPNTLLMVAENPADLRRHA